MSKASNITASEDTISSLLSRNYRYIVPEYQRQYSWGEEQWDDFWNDLTSIEEGESHFLGSIVVVERNTAFDELNQYEIVDGQQRLTTVSILLCAIRQYYLKHGESGAASSIEDNYLWEEDDDFQKKQKISLNSLDNSQYKRLLQGNPPRASESHIKKSIEYFSDRIWRLESEEVDVIRKHLLNSMTLVTISCDTQESAFRLFETLNDRGLELSEVDLMKNYLYKKAATTPAINADAIKQDWEDIIDSIRYELNKPYRFFIHYMLYAPEPSIRTSISRNRLYDRFRELVEEDIPKSSLSLEEYISQMANDTHLYLDIVNAEISEYDGPSNDRINELLSNLDRIGYTQERTYLLGVFAHTDSATEAIRAVRLVESYIIRQRYTGYITGSSLNELYADICSHAFSRDDPISYIRSQLVSQAPDSDELISALLRQDFSRSERTLYILRGLESEYYKNNGTLPKRAEIEHIAPRKSYTAKKYNTWPDSLGVSQEKFDGVKDKLGNLTILEKRLNLEASDNPFEQKKDKYRGSNYIMSTKLDEYDEWSIEVIEERTKQMAKEISDVWNFDI